MQLEVYEDDSCQSFVCEDCRQFCGCICCLQTVLWLYMLPTYSSMAVCASYRQFCGCICCLQTGLWLYMLPTGKVTALLNVALFMTGSLHFIRRLQNTKPDKGTMFCFVFCFAIRTLYCALSYVNVHSVCCTASENVTDSFFISFFLMFC